MKDLLDRNGYVEALLKRNLPLAYAERLIGRLKGENDEDVNSRVDRNERIRNDLRREYEQGAGLDRPVTD